MIKYASLMKRLCLTSCILFTLSSLGLVACSSSGDKAASSDSDAKAQAGNKVASAAERFVWKRAVSGCVAPSDLTHAGYNAGSEPGECIRAEGADWKGRDLRNVSLRGSKLKEVNFSHANLTGADLIAADLTDANLYSGAILTSAVFSTETKLPFSADVARSLGMIQISWKDLDEKLQDAIYERANGRVQDDREIERLLSLQADPNACPHLGDLLESKLFDTVRLLVRSGLNLKRPKATLLEYTHMPLQMLKLLLELGADANGDSDYGDGALHKFVKWGSPEQVTALLDAGANPNRLDGKCTTPLFHAPNPERGRLLLTRGASFKNEALTCQDKDGHTVNSWTLWNWVSGIDRSAMVSFALANGADPKIQHPTEGGILNAIGYVSGLTSWSLDSIIPLMDAGVSPTQGFRPGKGFASRLLQYIEDNYKERDQLRPALRSVIAHGGDLVDPDDFYDRPLLQRLFVGADLYPSSMLGFLKYFDEEGLFERMNVTGKNGRDLLAEYAANDVRYAAYEEDVFLDELLSRRKNLNQLDADGQPALSLCKSVSCFSKMLAHGANPNARGPGAHSPFVHLECNGAPYYTYDSCGFSTAQGIVDLLLGAGADVNLPAGKKNATALMEFLSQYFWTDSAERWAKYHYRYLDDGVYTVLDQLIKKSNLKLRDSDGLGVVDYAMRTKDPKVLQRLAPYFNDSPLFNVKWVSCASTDGRSIVVDLRRSMLASGNLDHALAWLKQPASNWSPYAEPVSYSFERPQSGTYSLKFATAEDDFTMSSRDLMAWDGKSKSGRAYSCRSIVGEPAPEVATNPVYDCGDENGFFALQAHRNGEPAGFRWGVGGLALDTPRDTKKFRRFEATPYKVETYPIFDEYDGWSIWTQGLDGREEDNRRFIFLPKSASAAPVGAKVELRIFKEAPRTASDPNDVASCVKH